MTEASDMMHLVYRIAHAINSSLHLEDTLQAILRAMQETLGYNAVVIRLLNPNADAMEAVASIGVSQQALAAMPAPVVPGSVHGRVLQGENVRVHSSKLTASPVGAGDALLMSWLETAQIGEMLAVPLQVRERTFGALNVFCSSGCGFDDETIILLRAIADLAALAIENARLHTSLFSIARAVTSSLELRPMLDQVLAATVLEMGLKAASIRLLDPSGTRLELVAAHGLSQRYLSKGAVLVSRSPMDQKLLAGEPVALFSVAEEPGFQYPNEAVAEGIRSVLAVPLRVKERIVGVMRVYSAQPRPFTSVGLEFLQSVAGIVSVAIENARLYEALRARYEDLKVDVSEWYRFLSLG